MNTKNLLIVIFTIAIGISLAIFFSDEHSHHSEHSEPHTSDHHHDDHEHAHSEEEHGPNGGKLLEKDNFAIELTLYETGIPPEMRLYAFENQKPIPPEQVNVTVVLDRLGGERNEIAFSPEKDYLLGEKIISEPHSFAVSVKAIYQGKTYQWQYESHEGRTEMTARLIKASGIETETAGPQTITDTMELYGIIQIPQTQSTSIFAPYSSKVEKMHVSIGDHVRKGQKLATLINTRTLQKYTLNSPAIGEVTQRWKDAGEIVQQDPLLEIADLSAVWVELSAFPNHLEKLKIGQSTKVSTLHGEQTENGLIDYISPTMTEGHIARARTTISNEKGLWRPGMHIKAEIMISAHKAPLAVKKSALQTLRGMPVVFARYGNTFEVRMIEIGRQNQTYAEVLSGLKPGIEYVTENSFLLKADALKAGATHSH